MPATIGKCRYEYESRASRLRSPPGSACIKPLGGDERDDVEVDPPERRLRSPTPSTAATYTSAVSVDMRTDAQRDDRLAEGEDDDQAVPFGEVRGHQRPSGDAEDSGPAEVHDDRRDPQRPCASTVGERRRRTSSPTPIAVLTARPDDRPAEVRVVARRDQEERDLAGPHDAVRDRERERTVTERLGDAERGDEQAGAMAANIDDPHAALFGIDHAREPGVAHPRPPQHAEHEHRPAHALPTSAVVGHERGALREREDEDEVEEQLERLDPFLEPRLRVDVRPATPSWWVGRGRFRHHRTACRGPG